MTTNRYEIASRSVHRLRDELGAIVHLDGLRRAMLGNNGIEHSHNVFPLQALADFDGQAFPGVVVHDRQCAQAPAVE